MENSNPTLWQNILDVLKDQETFALWQHLHGGFTHFPIALLFVAAAFDFGSVIFKQSSWRTVGFWCLMVAAVSAVFASVSGLMGGNGWFGTEWSGREMMEDGTPTIRSLANHRLIGLFSSGLTLILAIWRAVRKDGLQRAEWAAFLVLLLASVVSIFLAGLLGAYVSKGM